MTYSQYQTIMGSNPSKFQGDPSRPAEQATWHEAVEFCRQFSDAPQEKAAGAESAQDTDSLRASWTAETVDFVDGS